MHVNPREESAGILREGTPARTLLRVEHRPDVARERQSTRTDAAWKTWDEEASRETECCAAQQPCGTVLPRSCGSCGTTPLEVLGFPWNSRVMPSSALHLWRLSLCRPKRREESPRLLHLRTDNHGDRAGDNGVDGEVSRETARERCGLVHIAEHWASRSGSRSRCCRHVQGEPLASIGCMVNCAVPACAALVGQEHPAQFYSVAQGAAVRTHRVPSACSP